MEVLSQDKADLQPLTNVDECQNYKYALNESKVKQIALPGRDLYQGFPQVVKKLYQALPDNEAQEPCSVSLEWRKRL